MARNPVLTTHTAGWRAAGKAVRSGVITAQTPDDEVRQRARDMAHKHVDSLVASRPGLTERQQVELLDTFLLSFLDRTYEVEFHRFAIPAYV